MLILKEICKIKYQIFKEVMSILNIFFQKIETISNSSDEATITLILKLDKKIMNKGNYR